MLLSESLLAFEYLKNLAKIDYSEVVLDVALERVHKVGYWLKQVDFSKANLGPLGVVGAEGGEAADALAPVGADGELVRVAAQGAEVG